MLLSTTKAALILDWNAAKHAWSLPSLALSQAMLDYLVTTYGSWAHIALKWSFTGLRGGNFKLQLSIIRLQRCWCLSLLRCKEICLEDIKLCLSSEQILNNMSAINLVLVCHSLVWHLLEANKIQNLMTLLSILYGSILMIFLKSMITLETRIDLYPTLFHLQCLSNPVNWPFYYDWYCEVEKSWCKLRRLFTHQSLGVYILVSSMKLKPYLFSKH